MAFKGWTVSLFCVDPDIYRFSDPALLGGWGILDEGSWKEHNTDKKRQNSCAMFL